MWGFIVVVFVGLFVFFFLFGEFGYFAVVLLRFLDFFFLSLKNKNKNMGRFCITVNFCLRYLRKENQSLAGKILK